jgi:hypothetical protein
MNTQEHENLTKKDKVPKDLEEAEKSYEQISKALNDAKPIDLGKDGLDAFELAFKDNFSSISNAVIKSVFKLTNKVDKIENDLSLIAAALIGFNNNIVRLEENLLKSQKDMSNCIVNSSLDMIKAQVSTLEKELMSRGLKLSLEVLGSNTDKKTVVPKTCGPYGGNIGNIQLLGKKRRGIHCWKCGKEGHIAQVCKQCDICAEGHLTIDCKALNYRETLKNGLPKNTTIPLSLGDVASPNTGGTNVSNNCPESKKKKNKRNKKKKTKIELTREV